jgi:hypothetical protein
LEGQEYARHLQADIERALLDQFTQTDDRKRGASEHRLQALSQDFTGFVTALIGIIKSPEKQGIGPVSPVLSSSPAEEGGMLVFQRVHQDP